MSRGRSKRKVRRTCHLCDTKFDSQREQAEHFNGAFHKFMMSIKRTQMSYLENTKTLNEQITETGKKESLIGLEYIYEYAEDSNGVRMYECQLCDTACQSDEIFFHIVGIRHRVLYLVKHHPIMGIEADFDVQNQASYRKLANNALAIEQTHGRKKINVVDQVYVEKHKPYEDSDSESSSEGSKSSSSDSRSVDSRRSMSPVRRAARKRRRRKHRETNKLRRERRARARMLQEDDDYRRRDDSLSRERDRYLESRRDSLDRQRTQVLDCSEDFDARSMHRVGIPATLHDRDDARVLDGARDVQSRYRELGSVYLSDNRDIPNLQQDTRGGMAWQYGTGAAMLPDDRVGSLAQHGVASVSLYQQERPFQTIAGAASALGTTVPPYQQERQFLTTAGAAPPIGAAVSPYQQERPFQTIAGVASALGTTVPPYQQERPFPPTAGGAPPLGNTVPPYQQIRPLPPTAGAAPPLGTSLPLVGKGPTPEDAAEDLDLRRCIGVRGGPSLFHDGDYKGSSASGDSRDHSRRRNRSPDPRDRANRNRSTYLGDCGDIDVRFMLPTGGISFRELKAAHEKTLLGGSSSGNLPPWEKKKEKDGDSDTEVCSMEFSDGEPEDFWCNEELFDFLKTYHIGDEEDVQFILKAIKVLSESMMRHKTRKEELQKWISQEKQKLEEEKKVFLQLKKRKEDNIFATTMKSTELENIKLFKKVTGEKNVTAPKPTAEKPQETVKQPEQATSFEKPPLWSPAPAAPKAVPKPAVSSAQKVDPPQPKTTSKKARASGKAPKVPQPQAQSVNEPLPLTNFQKALVSGSIAPLLEAAGFVTQPQQGAFSQKALVSGLGPLVQQLQKPQGSGAGSNTNPRLPGPKTANQSTPGQAPGGYSGAGAGSNPNPRVPGPRVANPNLPGQALGGYSGAGAGSNPNPRLPGSRMANPNLQGQAQGGYSGAGAGSNPNPRLPGSRMANPNLQGQAQGGYSGSGPGSNRNPLLPAPRMANPNLPGQAPGGYSGAGAGSNPNLRFPGSRMANPNLQGQAPGGYSGAGAGSNMNSRFPGPRFSNPNLQGQAPGRFSGDGAGSNPNLGFPGQRFSNPNLPGQAPGRFSGPNMRFGQNTQIPGGRLNLDPSKQQRPFGGQAAVRNPEQYTQAQWQSQFGGAEESESEPQSEQPTGSAGFSSDRRQGTFPNQNPPKPGVYPAGILKNRTGNPPSSFS
ncbi:uncharacterized protein LOC122922091 isoform X4 [Bufo gargarizans]|uniref:uncharacterized protein LOC122922091 isoform X4 n=1 Tax=Bufo gargarizans TaxID=30331 RepID=UPI001CF4B2ED|nr:uncharacterized protein LOC122922091 isoform X4 [Bufo gargarizans]